MLPRVVLDSKETKNTWVTFSPKGVPPPTSRETSTPRTRIINSYHPPRCSWVLSAFTLISSSCWSFLSTAGGSSGSLEFLIKENESTKPLVTSKAGATVEMSTVMGKGFPIVENFRGYKYDFPIQNVVLSATGTG